MNAQGSTDCPLPENYSYSWVTCMFEGGPNQFLCFEDTRVAFKLSGEKSWSFLSKDQITVKILSILTDKLDKFHEEQQEKQQKAFEAERNSKMAEIDAKIKEQN